MLPQGHAVEAPQDHVLVGVVSGVPDCQILEQTTVHPKDLVHPGPHLLAATEHAPSPSVLRTQNISRKEVLHHIL